jgi:hypothetical protein
MAKSGSDLPGQGMQPAPPAAERGYAGMVNLSKTSMALGNLRSFVIQLVIGFHSVLAYTSSQPAAASFDNPPYDWQAFPTLDQ